jgi:long-chain acyl-CoA synthetase
MHPAHPHQLARELAFGSGEIGICVGTSMAETIHAAMEIYRDRQCIGVRDVDKDNHDLYINSYSWQTYKTVGDRARKFGNGLRNLIQPRDYLGICAANRPEWVITDLACMLNSIISVPIYCLMSDRDTAFVINNTKISVIVCDKEMLPKFLRLHSECPSLHWLICMDQVLETTPSKCKD